MRNAVPNARDFTNQSYRWNGRIDEAINAKDRTKSRVRAKVERVFEVIKRVLGFDKIRHRGLAKNLHRLEVTAGKDAPARHPEVRCGAAIAVPRPENPAFGSNTGICSFLTVSRTRSSHIP
jgi:hypothetical protein